MRIFVFADFANSSRRRLLRPAVGFMGTSRPSVRRERRLASKAVRCVLIAVAMRLAQVGRERGSVRNGVYALTVAPTVIYMLILVASLAASVRSLKPTAHFCRATETPMFAIWRLGDDPFNRYRVNAGTVGGHIWFSNARRTFAGGWLRFCGSRQNKIVCSPGGEREALPRDGRLLCSSGGYSLKRLRPREPSDGKLAASAMTAAKVSARFS